MQIHGVQCEIEAKFLKYKQAKDEIESAKAKAKAERKKKRQQATAAKKREGGNLSARQKKRATAAAALGSGQAAAALGDSVRLEDRGGWMGMRWRPVLRGAGAADDVGPGLRALRFVGSGLTGLIV